MDWINRAPVDVESGEARYEILVTTACLLPKVRRSVVEQLTEAHYPVSDIEVIDRGEGRAEIVAPLVSTAVVAAERDAVIEKIAAIARVEDVSGERSELE